MTYGSSTDAAPALKDQRLAFTLRLLTVNRTRRQSNRPHENYKMNSPARCVGHYGDPPSAVFPFPVVHAQHLRPVRDWLHESGPRVGTIRRRLGLYLPTLSLIGTKSFLTPLNAFTL